MPGDLAAATVAWHQCWSGEALDRARTVPAWQELLQRWREPHRRYHALDHLVACLAAWGNHRDRLREPWLVGLALAWHDAVYDPRAIDNEARSARLAHDALTAAGLAPARADRVADLVRATARHAPTDDADLALLLDIDLAILGAEPDAYDRYVTDVRAVTAPAHDAGWRRGRAAVLRGFLDRPRIFHSDTYRAHEPHARANLMNELATVAEAEDRG